ncbi:mannitol dehydrogenase family protein [Jatrophihabitans lederbergiae]|uniref:Mannitol-1-phosphate 5-dehydrogenase n=1 Tax=Jatrophihabitans lederbergiae TaxID=3075547 RepID=A0ABU2J6M1_9ACTN|nr:mannitol dehydrogenase family protein [Jatrophihabitans sp. DSM 44399]MDT0260639.1 mannitol dehydrogenase family protein [Jatrophihabitans sp. DSM 44399]
MTESPNSAVLTPLPLTEETLHQHPETVLVPAYDRSALAPAVVHVGVGGFHRAHQAVYFDELARRGITDWGVVGIGMHRRKMGEVLGVQDNLFTVVERGTEQSSARVVGAMVDYLLLSEQRDAVSQRLRDPRTRLVTLTVTGDGYTVPDSAEAAENSIFPVLVEALDERRKAGVAPFTVLSCDNLPDSGEVARQAVLGCAGSSDPELTSWIEAEVAFPGGMVDRITPSTSPEERDRIEQEFHVADQWPVITEPFAQWVIEDRFCNGRPPLDQVGVRFVDDVAPYKLIKSRLLNGSHCALGYLGSLAGYERSDEAMADPVIAAFLEKLMRDEVAPLLPPDVPGMELEEYCTSLLARLANAAIGDQLSRLAGRGTTKMPDYVLPSLFDARAKGSPSGLLTLVVAGWLRYVRGVDLAGERFEFKDARGDELRALAEDSEGDPRLLLALTDIFDGLSGNEEFAAEVQRLMAMIDDQGVQGTMNSVLHSQ